MAGTKKQRTKRHHAVKHWLEDWSPMTPGSVDYWIHRATDYVEETMKQTPYLPLDEAVSVCVDKVLCECPPSVWHKVDTRALFVQRVTFLYGLRRVFPLDVSFLK